MRSSLAKFLYDLGAKIVGISNAYGGLHESKWLRYRLFITTIVMVWYGNKFI